MSISKTKETSTCQAYVQQHDDIQQVQSSPDAQEHKSRAMELDATKKSEKELTFCQISI